MLPLSTICDTPRPGIIALTLKPRGLSSCEECLSMDAIGTWIDAKSHRFQLMLLANTAAFVCALLLAMARF